jgi:hypothetical protein
LLPIGQQSCTLAALLDCADTGGALDLQLEFSVMTIESGLALRLPPRSKILL